ncbi:hypothetical protein AAEX63_12665 [Luteococcus sp. H138]|uniref:hypothetical protein n=1 Tax=unclassified Luteococcus TaxID=2639923 RepID=UPI00313D9549
MPRRVSLPGASELFRATSSGVEVGPEPTEAAPQPVKRSVAKAAKAPAKRAPAQRPAASGRVKHDEKITVYVSRDELIRLEQARLMMRGDYGLAVDRGRIVRESIALAMEDLAVRGPESDLARRLNGD